MAIRRGELRNVVALQRTQQVEADVEPQVAQSPLYGVAMLKIAMELKKADGKSLEELIAGVLARMKLPEDDFRSFLAANGGLLRTIALAKKY
jgi:hypothetical protein